ncbi:MAG: hypothetical protein LBQ90_03100 [Synergistaceae bacterium]|jgi:hypothetical protein|nr:hypothetical protein [Synergistaceae bacterium]
MRIVTTNSTIHTTGYTYHKVRGPEIRRTSIDYEHVQEPVTVARPQIEDFDSRVIVHDKMEYYS